MEQVLESRGIWRAQRSTKHVIEHFVFNAKSEYGGILVSLVTAYVSYVLLFIPDSKISKFKHWSTEKGSYELAAMVAKSKESPSQARQIVSTNCVTINEL